MAQQVGQRRPAQQVRAEPAAAAEGPEQPVRVRELADQLLRAADLGLGGPVVVGLLAERDGVGEGVVADPVPLGVRALGQRPARRVG